MNYLDTKKLTFEEIMTNIKTNPRYVDDRGSIDMIMENCEIGSVSRITSHPETERANHYHINDNHTIIVNEGQIFIYERPTGTEEYPLLTILNKGDIHFTPAKVDHTMYFPCYTVFDCYSKLPRNSANYEKETVRIPSLREVYEAGISSCGCR